MKLISGNSLEVLSRLLTNSVHCIVTSPPYYGLRIYGTEPVKWPCVRYSILGFEVIVPEMSCELGQEPDPKAFVGHLVLIFRESKRVLRDDGTLWVNIGDSYASSEKNRTVEQSGKNGRLHGSLRNHLSARKQISKLCEGFKPKDLIGIPWMLAHALRADGWYLRMDIIWSKLSAMPESVTDRPTRAHEYVFLLSKSEKYYYNAEAIRTVVRGGGG